MLLSVMVGIKPARHDINLRGDYKEVRASSSYDGRSSGLIPTTFGVGENSEPMIESLIFSLMNKVFIICQGLLEEGGGQGGGAHHAVAGELRGDLGCLEKKGPLEIIWLDAPVNRVVKVGRLNSERAVGDQGNKQKQES
jgi:hypothetical protein